MASFDVNALMRSKYTDFKTEDPDVLFKGEVLKKSSALMVFDSMNGYRPRLAIVHRAGLLLTWKNPLEAPKKVFTLKDGAAVAEKSPANAFSMLTTEGGKEKVYLFAGKDAKQRVDIMAAMATARLGTPAAPQA